MTDVYRREEVHTHCKKCDGTGIPLRVPGDPESGHIYGETCKPCHGTGRMTAIITYANFAKAY